MKGIKTGGRQKGTQNNISTVIKKQIETILSTHFTTVQIEQDIATLEPKDRLMMYMKLLEYSIPKKKATDLTGDDLNTVFHIKLQRTELASKLALVGKDLEDEIYE
jgi:hypothetical protein